MALTATETGMRKGSITPPGAEIMRCIEKMDQLKERREWQERVEGKFQPKASGDANGKAAKKTAAIVGVSQSTVERACAVLSDIDSTDDSPRIGSPVPQKLSKFGLGAGNDAGNKIRGVKPLSLTP
jgi:hypothetical protein